MDKNINEGVEDNLDDTAFTNQLKDPVPERFGEFFINQVLPDFLESPQQDAFQEFQNDIEFKHQRLAKSNAQVFNSFKIGYKFLMSRHYIRQIQQRDHGKKLIEWSEKPSAHSFDTSSHFQVSQNSTRSLRSQTFIEASGNEPITPLMLSDMTENTIGWEDSNNQTKVSDGSFYSDSFGDTARESQQTFITTDISNLSQDTFDALVRNMDIQAYPISILQAEQDDILYQRSIDGIDIRIDQTSDEIGQSEVIYDRDQLSALQHDATNSYINKDILGFENLQDSKCSSLLKSRTQAHLSQAEAESAQGSTKIKIEEHSINSVNLQQDSDDNIEVKTDYAYKNKLLDLSNPKNDANVTADQMYRSPTFREDFQKDKEGDITFSLRKRRRESPDFQVDCYEEFQEYVRSKSNEKTAQLNLRNKKLTVVNSQDSLLEEDHESVEGQAGDETYGNQKYSTEDMHATNDSNGKESIQDQTDGDKLIKKNLFQIVRRSVTDSDDKDTGLYEKSQVISPSQEFIESTKKADDEVNFNEDLQTSKIESQVSIKNSESDRSKSSILIKFNSARQSPEPNSILLKKQNITIVENKDDSKVSMMTPVGEINRSQNTVKSFRIRSRASGRRYKSIRKKKMSSSKSQTHSSPSPNMNYSRSKSKKSKTKSASRYASAEERECEMNFSQTPRSPFMRDKIQLGKSKSKRSKIISPKLIQSQYEPYMNNLRADDQKLKSKSPGSKRQKYMSNRSKETKQTMSINMQIGQALQQQQDISSQEVARQSIQIFDVKSSQKTNPPKKIARTIIDVAAMKPPRKKNKSKKGRKISEQIFSDILNQKSIKMSSRGSSMPSKDASKTLMSHSKIHNSKVNQKRKKQLRNIKSSINAQSLNIPYSMISSTTNKDHGAGQKNILIQVDAHQKMLQQLEHIEIGMKSSDSQSKVLSESFAFKVPKIKSRHDVMSLQVNPNIQGKQNAMGDMKVAQFDHQVLEGQKVFESQRDRDSLQQNSLRQNPEMLNQHQIISENLKQQDRSYQMYLSENHSNEQSYLEQSNPFQSDNEGHKVLVEKAYAIPEKKTEEEANDYESDAKESLMNYLNDQKENLNTDAESISKRANSVEFDIAQDYRACNIHQKALDNVQEIQEYNYHQQRIMKSVLNKTNQKQFRIVKNMKKHENKSQKIIDFKLNKKWNNQRIVNECLRQQEIQNNQYLKRLTRGRKQRSSSLKQLKSPKLGGINAKSFESRKRSQRSKENPVAKLNEKQLVRCPSDVVIDQESQFTEAASMRVLETVPVHSPQVVNEQNKSIKYSLDESGFKTIQNEQKYSDYKSIDLQKSFQENQMSRNHRYKKIRTKQASLVTRSVTLNSVLNLQKNTIDQAEHQLKKNLRKELKLAIGKQRQSYQLRHKQQDLRQSWRAQPKIDLAMEFLKIESQEATPELTPSLKKSQNNKFITRRKGTKDRYEIHFSTIPQTPTIPPILKKSDKFDQTPYIQPQTLEQI